MLYVVCIYIVVVVSALIFLPSELQEEKPREKVKKIDPEFEKPEEK
jgi:hypothetical protein